MSPYQLGRIPQFDSRNTNYHIRKLLPSSYIPRPMLWVCNTRLNQGSIPSCTGNAFAHDLAGKPVEIKNVTEDTALKIYQYAQTLDGIPLPHEGSSILAAVKAVLFLYPGAYDAYHWGYNIADVILALSYTGPVIFGINWLDQMFYPDTRGVIEAKGDIAGGHAIYAIGINPTKKLIRLRNSWGAFWGVNGDCFISYSDLDKLLQDNGECCIPTGRHMVTV